MQLAFSHRRSCSRGTDAAKESPRTAYGNVRRWVRNKGRDDDDKAGKLRGELEKEDKQHGAWKFSSVWKFKWYSIRQYSFELQQKRIGAQWGRYHSAPQALKEEAEDRTVIAGLLRLGFFSPTPNWANMLRDPPRSYFTAKLKSPQAKATYKQEIFKDSLNYGHFKMCPWNISNYI